MSVWVLVSSRGEGDYVESVYDSMEKAEAGWTKLFEANVDKYDFNGAYIVEQVVL